MTLSFSQYDTRHYPTVDVGEGYAAWSSTYDRTADSQVDIPLLERLRAVDWRSIRTAVDLACGTGRIGRWLRDRGVKEIEGVDCSPSMLRHAASRGIYKALHEADVARSQLPDSAFDLGISVLAACHLPDLSKLYAEAARLVRPSGWLAVLDYHPFFLLRGIPTHFDTASGPVAIENFVHLTSEHINSGIRCGWVPAGMHERMVDEQWGRERPSMSKHLNHPVRYSVENDHGPA